MKAFLKRKFILPLVTVVILMAALIVPLSGSPLRSHAVGPSRPSKLPGSLPKAQQFLGAPSIQQTPTGYLLTTFLVIRNFGSTNSPGFTITINHDGSGTLVYAKCTFAPTRPQCQQPNTTFAPKTFPLTDVVQTLSHIGNIQGIPHHRCTKSVSFGSVTKLVYNGQTSGDISCINATDSQTDQQLEQEIQAFISQALQ